MRRRVAREIFWNIYKANKHQLKKSVDDALEEMQCLVLTMIRRRHVSVWFDKHLADKMKVKVWLDKYLAEDETDNDSE